MTVATTEDRTPDMGAFDENDQNVIRYLGLNPANPADRAMVAVCRAYDFDPVLKHVVVIPKGGVYITRDGLLHVAHRSGQLDGIVVEQMPTLVDGEWVATVSVYRKDMRHPFTFPGRYPLSGSNKQYAQEMALKAAEAHALRRAFDVTGLPTLDEQRPERHVTYVEQPASGADRMAAMLHPETSPPDVAPDEAPAGASVEPPVSSGGESPLLDVKSDLAKAMFASINSAGITEAERLPWISSVIGRDVSSSKEMTDDDARKVLNELDRMKDASIEDAEVVEP